MQEKTKDNMYQNNFDNRNIEELMASYKPLVSRIARRYFLYGGELDDLMQEGMIGLYKAIKGYDSTKQASFKTFATLCITRQIQSAIRAANSKKNIVLGEIIDKNLADFDVATNKENPETNFIQNQNYEKFVDEIKNKLSKKEMEIFDCYLEGFSYEQIARKLDIERKSVDNALVRIRTKITQIITNNGER